MTSTSTIARPLTRRFFTLYHEYLTPTHPPKPTRRPLSTLRKNRIPSHRALHPATSPKPQQQKTTTRHPHRPASTLSQTDVPPPKEETPSHPPTHYDLFPQTLPAGPPPASPFEIDLRILRSEFLQLQALTHPDRHQGPDRLRAEGASARINEAYKTLQSPLLRAQYLLGLQGVDVANDERMKIEDEELLLEVLEAREVIEEAEEEGDLDGLRGENESRVGDSERSLADAFGRGDVEGAKREAVRLRYWINIKESLEGWQRGKPVVLVH